jgi:hypothetical protein
MIGVLRKSENYVLSFLAGIAYRLILKELESNVQYHHNLRTSCGLRKLRTLCSLFGLSAEDRHAMGTALSSLIGVQRLVAALGRGILDPA